MDNSQTYIPINCSFYDYLEEAATLKLVSNIVFWQEGASKTIKTRIKTLFIKDKVEYMLLDTNQKIRLDKLISFNDKKLLKPC